MLAPSRLHVESIMMSKGLVFRQLGENSPNFFPSDQKDSEHTPFIDTSAVTT